VPPEEQEGAGATGNADESRHSRLAPESDILRHSRASGNPAFSVIPAKAGIQFFEVIAGSPGYLLSQV
jgi:hypothetical protein